MQLVECPKCEISYTPQLLHCPRCKEFATPMDQHWSFLEKNALLQMHDGISAQEVREQLQRAGMPESKIERIVDSASAIVGWESRRIGFTRILVGSWMIVFAMVICGLLLWITQSVGFLGPNRRFIVLISAGVLVVGGGGWLLVMGIWNAISGKE